MPTKEPFEIAVPESPERNLRELELRESAMLLVIFKGWVAPEIVNATQRITALAEKSGNLVVLRNSVLMRGFGALFAGDFPTAGALADQALKLAQREGNGLADTYLFQLQVRVWRGDLTVAEQHFQAGLKFFDDPLFKQKPIGGSVDAFGYGSLNAWTLGRPDIARQRLAQMMAAVDRNTPGHLVNSAFNAAWLHLFMRDYEKAEGQAAQSIGVSEQHQFPTFTVVARCFLGIARAQLGRATEGIALLRQGMAGMLGLGIRVVIGGSQVSLSEAQAREGATLAALETIEQALEANPDELIYRPEALRIRGQLRLKQAQTELAEDDFREAISLARGMGGKAWELRATMSLARLLAKQGKRDKARAMLAEIYGWFTEGFDTRDLKDAKALLDELNT